MTGVISSESLINFSSTAKSNYERYADAQATGGNYVHKAVSVTEEDEKLNLKIENCSKKEIKRHAFEIVSKLDREKQCNYEEFFMKEFAKKHKEQFLNFY